MNMKSIQYNRISLLYILCCSETLPLPPIHSHQTHHWYHLLIQGDKGSTDKGIHLLGQVAGQEGGLMTTAIGTAIIDNKPKSTKSNRKIPSTGASTCRILSGRGWTRNMSMRDQRCVRLALIHQRTLPAITTSLRRRVSSLILLLVANTVGMEKVTAARTAEHMEQDSEATTNLYLLSNSHRTHTFLLPITPPTTTTLAAHRPMCLQAATFLLLQPTLRWCRTKSAGSESHHHPHHCKGNLPRSSSQQCWSMECGSHRTLTNSNLMHSNEVHKQNQYRSTFLSPNSPAHSNLLNLTISWTSVVLSRLQLPATHSATSHSSCKRKTQWCRTPRRNPRNSRYSKTLWQVKHHWCQMVTSDSLLPKIAKPLDLPD